MGKTKETYEDLKLKFDSLVEDHEALLESYREQEKKLSKYKKWHKKALRHAQYCGDQWEYFEDRCDQLTIIADSLASEIDGGLLNFFIEKAVEQIQQTQNVKAKLQKLIKIIEIVNWDFDGGMVEITEQEYRLIKDAIRATREM